MIPHSKIFMRDAKRKKILLPGIASLMSLIPVTSVHASAALKKVRGVAKKSKVPGAESGTSLQAAMGGLIQQMLGMVGVVLVILIIYGGLMWMTAGGNEEKVTKAKKLLTSAIIGIVIIFGAYAITEFVLKSVLTATGS